MLKAITTAAALLASSVAHGWSCPDVSTIGDAFKYSHDIVFKGVVSNTDKKISSATFNIITTYRGDARESVVVYFDGMFNGGPFNLVVGKTY